MPKRSTITRLCLPMALFTALTAGAAAAQSPIDFTAVTPGDPLASLPENVRMITAFGERPAFSPDGRWLYHTDTVRRVIYRFARTAEGAENREEFIRVAEADGSPDGMTADSQGYLWVGHWGGGKVSRFAPDGSLDRVIALPAHQVTNVAFAGAALDRLFVTSAADGLPPSEFDGALFEIDPGGATGVMPGIFPG